MDTIRCPDIQGAVEFEQNEECQENARNTSKVRIDEEVLGGMSDIVVESILIDINTEENTAGDEENIVVDELLSNGVVEGRGARGGGVELAEWVDKKLGRRQEQVDCDQTEDFS